MAYITIQDLRDEGITVSDAENNFVEKRIALAQSIIDEMTGRFFEKREAYKIVLDGKNSPIIILDVPPITENAITEILVNDVALESEDYKVVMPNPESRFIPKLKKVSGKWPEGILNLEITGDFGFVEPDESSPPLVKRLCKLLTVWNMPQLGNVDVAKIGKIIEEELGDYSYKLSEAASIGMFGDEQIDGLINMYKVKRVTTL